MDGGGKAHVEEDVLAGSAERFQDLCSLWYCFRRKREVWNTCKKQVLGGN